MTAQQVGGWSRRAFLRCLMLVGALGVFGVCPRPVAAVETAQASGDPDKPSEPGVCPQRDAHAHTICPNCCTYGYEAT
jgi:hypothetical protein